jgi:Ni,Fe-hydrogenase III large subunit
MSALPARKATTAPPAQLRWDDFRDALERTADGGSRLALLTARRSGMGLALVAVLLDRGRSDIIETVLPPEARSYLSFTPRLPRAHWFERALHDFFGLVPEQHPRFKSLVLHEAWPADWHPLRNPPAMPDPEAPRRAYPFLEVKGHGVYEIPVGPIHAGIIEPGHFRFSCLGEVIQNLEIRLGYQHRGIEQRLTEMPWRHARWLVEAASSDTAVGNGLAHALALEHMCGVRVPPAASLMRAVALEIERVASHLADLGGICADIGFSGGASVFARLRGQALSLGERLTGSRFLTGYVRPGGVGRVPDGGERADLIGDARALQAALARALPLLLDNPDAVDRMQGRGRVRPALARDFGLVGPAGRASGVAWDARVGVSPWADFGLRVRCEIAGDVLARVQVRGGELEESLRLLPELLSAVDGPGLVALPGALPAGAAAVGVVEAWRGELVHLVMTDERGSIARYAIKDPSFDNWTGLSIAARFELVSDFPLCNKSFSLSYSGNDL